MTTMVTVSVPDGVYEGQEFVLEYEGQQLSVVCPDGCGPGSEINLEIPTPAAEGASAGGSQQVEVVVPDGWYAYLRPGHARAHIWMHACMGARGRARARDWAQGHPHDDSWTPPFSLGTCTCIFRCPPP